MDVSVDASVVSLIGIGLLTGVTTVLFGFGGGFVAVPVVVWADAALGADAMRVAAATSALVMAVNAGFATAVTPRRVLRELRGGGTLLLLLAAGAAAGAVATRLAPAGPARWAFVAYVAATIADLLLRPGFLRAGTGQAPAGAPAPLPARLGVPVGAIAAFLGVGGSVMTVPAMRRAGHTMRVATALANPLTLAIAVPAAAVSLAGATIHAHPGAPAHLMGLVDLRAASALLLGALPVIAVLRLRPPRIPDRPYAWTYIGLLAAVVIAMLLLP
ncbi:sulfite exporter TauE/SafE family protein [Streptomyces montanisoli]|uniref:sulfite exporter TauE/SafE family protein n=1 Tax=Streptomyces montanisoli TaxID=2798581 RepID=UPI0027DB4CD9|nr:sulfite exporter TauE/SafE family protein [Streptomyces montanisoli]